MRLRGRIDEDRLNRLTRENYNRFTYFICGPPGFTATMKKILKKHRTDVSRIITEDFSATNRFSQVLFPRDRTTRLTYAFSLLSLTVGVLLIMAIDLIRAVPKLEVADNLHVIQVQRGQSTGSNPNENKSGHCPNRTLCNNTYKLRDF